jgi:hypothetical protein
MDKIEITYSTHAMYTLLITIPTLIKEGRN